MTIYKSILTFFFMRPKLGLSDEIKARSVQCFTKVEHLLNPFFCRSWLTEKKIQGWT